MEKNRYKKAIVFLRLETVANRLWHIESIPGIQYSSLFISRQTREKEKESFLWKSLYISSCWGIVEERGTQKRKTRFPPRGGIFQEPPNALLCEPFLLFFSYLIIRFSPDIFPPPSPQNNHSNFICINWLTKNIKPKENESSHCFFKFNYKSNRSTRIRGPVHSSVVQRQTLWVLDTCTQLDRGRVCK